MHQTSAKLIGCIFATLAFVGSAVAGGNPCDPLRTAGANELLAMAGMAVEGNFDDHADWVPAGVNCRWKAQASSPKPVRRRRRSLRIA